MEPAFWKTELLGGQKNSNSLNINPKTYKDSAQDQLKWSNLISSRCKAF